MSLTSSRLRTPLGIIPTFIYCKCILASLAILHRSKMKSGLYITKLRFSDETTLDLNSNSILVLTGPNTAGKSSVLREIKRDLDSRERRNNALGPVLKGMETSLKGDFSDLIGYLSRRYDYEPPAKEIKLGHSHKYLLKTVQAQFKKGRVPAPLEATFVRYLNASGRLGGENRDRVEEAATILNDDEPQEILVSEIFKKAFGSDIILNRTSDGNRFHLGDRKELPKHAERLKPDFRKWMEKLPLMSEQGDGVRSFCRVMRELLVEPGSIILIDEPEVFLHPPQIRQLARMIATQTSRDTQIIAANHSDDFVKGLLDSSVDRVTLVRLKRHDKINRASILRPAAISHLWQDPLLRTSGLLSALFHQVAIICEGESDARFFQALMDATEKSKRDPDFRFYHCGGKDRVAGIAQSLRAVKVPTVARRFRLIFR